MVAFDSRAALTFSLHRGAHGE